MLFTAFFVLVLSTLWNLMTLIYNLGRSHVQENTFVLYLFSFEPHVKNLTFFSSHKYLNLWEVEREWPCSRVSQRCLRKFSFGDLLPIKKCIKELGKVWSEPLIDECWMDISKAKLYLSGLVKRKAFMGGLIARF